MYVTINTRLLFLFPYYTKIFFPSFLYYAEIFFPISSYYTEIFLTSFLYYAEIFFPISPYYTEIFFPSFPYYTEIFLYFYALHLYHCDSSRDGVKCQMYEGVSIVYLSSYLLYPPDNVKCNGLLLCIILISGCPLLTQNIRCPSSFHSSCPYTYFTPSYITILHATFCLENHILQKSTNCTIDTFGRWVIYSYLVLMKTQRQSLQK